MMNQQKSWGWLYLVCFILTIPLSNWMVTNIGTHCYPDGPCVIPVWPGIESPSAVLIAGLALVLRDRVQDFLGVKATLVAIFAGTIISATLSDPAVVLGSTCAFLFSELADLFVYTPLRKQNQSLAIILSGLVGAIVDSMIFLQLAFGSLAFLEGQVIGKFWMSLLVGILFFVMNKTKKNPVVTPC